jgi:hypothetical protein
MTYLILRYVHLLGLTLMGAGLIGVWYAALRSRQVRDLDLPLLGELVRQIAVFYDGVAVSQRARPTSGAGASPRAQRNETMYAATAFASASLRCSSGMWRVGARADGFRNHRAKAASVYRAAVSRRSGAIGVPTGPMVWQPWQFLSAKTRCPSAMNASRSLALKLN